MLTHISISQFTVVDTLQVEFQGGLTVLTGETGAGKSIILDALGLCLGDRADSSAIRPGSERAELSANFDVGAIPAAQAWLAERELSAGEDCLLRRVLTREGRSRAFINGSPATLQDCAALGGLLIDIHGQHAHQSLVRRAHQRALLDSYAKARPKLTEVDETARQWKSLHEQLTSLRDTQREQADREQLLRYQVSELDELALKPGELQSLENEQRLLANADIIQRQAARSIELCENQEAGVRAAIGELDPELHDLAAVGNAREMLQSAAIQIDEARLELQQYLAGCESNPQRLEEVEARLDTVYSLARKHRIEAEALPAHHETLSEELLALDSSDDRLEALEAELTALSQQYEVAAKTLVELRTKGSRKLEKEVAKLLGKLSMNTCRFEVALTPRDSETPHPLGTEDVEFLIATNPGAEPQSLARVASGGELSRISLAVQVATVGDTTVPCMVFDEVDVGIGGAVAEVVGRLLAEMGKDSQVLCVTHLAQVAAQGNQHLQVAKTGKGKAVSSSLSLLDEKQRIEEIARMLGGVKMTENTLAHAREMLAGGA